MRARLFRLPGFPVGLLLALALAACVPDPPVTSAPTAAQGAYLGVVVGESETDAGARAAVVFFVLPDSAAERAGLQEGDRLLTVAGRQVTSGTELVAVLREQRPESTVPAVLVRRGERLELAVKLGAASPDNQQRSATFFARREQEELQAGAAAQVAGDRAAAFGHYVRATRAGYRLASGPDQSLAQLAASLKGLRPPPAVPLEAERLNQRAMTLFQRATSDADNERAVAEMGGAVFAAPWIADLHLNNGLVLARAGYPQQAATAMRRYLLFNAAAGDAAAVRQKIVDFELAAEEQAPWQGFLSTWAPSNGGSFAIGLRGNTLTARVVRPEPDTDQKPGDMICSGTIRGTSFSGRCAMWLSKEKAKACFGSKREYEADGSIEGNTLKVMTTTGLNYGTETCIINSEQRGALIWVTRTAGSS